MSNLPMTPFGTVRHRIAEATSMNYDNEADEIEMNHEELPTTDEAELGELCQTPEGVESHDLTKTPPTYEEIFGDDEAETEECRFCGLRLKTLRDNHEEKCPEGLPPTCWDSVDAEQLKMEAEAMGFVVYEGGVDL